MTPGPAALQSARTVADAVLYEGYLLYPYRASAGQNQSRWQFGVLGPRGAADAGVGEEPGLATEFLVQHQPGAELTVTLRFLQLQARTAERLDDRGELVPVEDLCVGAQRWLSWDEAVEHELHVATVCLPETGTDVGRTVDVDGGEDVTDLVDDEDGPAGRLVRRRWPLAVSVRLSSGPVPGAAGVSRVSIVVENRGSIEMADARSSMDTRSSTDAEQAVAATRRSLLGAHLLLGCAGGTFVSMTDPPSELRAAADGCRQHRCWPVLAGPAGEDDVLLVSPIILEDHPSVAAQSPGSLFDSTEIDEVLTLRILTMTEQEKAEARATDPRAAEIIDRSERLSTQEMSRLHGVMYDPLGSHSTAAPQPDRPWWDPESEADVDPATDAVLVAGTRVRRGSLVLLRPSRRADAQDLFLAGLTGRVTGVHRDVDGATHVGVVLVDDPAADLHEWYGRYLYFGPEELEPLGTTTPGPDPRRETRR